MSSDPWQIQPDKSEDSPTTDQRPACHRQRVLMLSHRVPFPLDRGDRIRGYHILKYLSEHFDVALGCTSFEPITIGQQQAVSELAGRVAIQQISGTGSKLRGLGSLLIGTAVTPACFHRRSLRDTIVTWHEQQPFDAVLTYCTAMVHYARCLMQRTPRPRHIIDLVNVDSAKWSDFAQHTWSPMRWVYRAESSRLRRIEAGDLDHFDAITVVSNSEAALYRRRVGQHPGLKVLRHAVDIDYFRPMPDADSKMLLFTGVLNYKPNTDGVTWFVRQVMPLLRKRLKDVRLLIVGRDVTGRVRALNEHLGVEVVGAVPDVREYLRRASAVIAPLRIARGIQTKVLEAMASTRAVVCSPAAADGIVAEDGRHLLVANDPQHWAEQLERVLVDASLRRRLARAGRQQVEDMYP